MKNTFLLITLGVRLCVKYGLRQNILGRLYREPIKKGHSDGCYLKNIICLRGEMGPLTEARNCK